MPNLAIDSRPLGKCIYSSTDYSGLQLYGLEHRSLQQNIVELFSDGKNLNIRLGDHTWEDGSLITGKDYLDGLLKLMSFQPQLKMYMKKNLREIAVLGQRITLKFHNEYPAGRQWVEIPNWVPFREGLRSGAYKLNFGSTGWELQGQDGSQGKVMMVHSPSDNISNFRKGNIDFTADTAIFFEDIDESANKYDTGLFGVLSYSKNLEESVVSTLSWDLSSLRFSDLIESHWSTLRHTIEQPHKIVRRTVSLSYDSFYPNREISERVSEHLSACGWQVKLIMENYYEPNHEGDIRFSILRALAKNSLFHGLTLMSYPRSGLARAAIESSISKIEKGHTFCFSTLSDLGLGFPLFKIPSVFLSKSTKSNPLLEVLL